LNQVYDVTPYVEEHPGGDAILNNAGADSTEGFFGLVTYCILFFIACSVSTLLPLNGLVCFSSSIQHPEFSIMYHFITGGGFMEYFY
jgi:hypothetical protein